jgi:hypothetical protein
MSCLKDSEATCPAHSEVVASLETRPLPTCVFIVHNLAPTFHVGFVVNEILAPRALTKVEDILPKETSAV